MHEVEVLVPNPPHATRVLLITEREWYHLPLTTSTMRRGAGWEFTWRGKRWDRAACICGEDFNVGFRWKSSGYYYTCAVFVQYILNIIRYIEYCSKSCLIHRLVQLIINQQKLVWNGFDSRDVRCQNVWDKTAGRCKWLWFWFSPVQSPDRQLVASPFLKSRRRKTTLPGEGNQAVAVIAFAGPV